MKQKIRNVTRPTQPSIYTTIYRRHATLDSYRVVKDLPYYSFTPSVGKSTSIMATRCSPSRPCICQRSSIANAKVSATDRMKLFEALSTHSLTRGPAGRQHEKNMHMQMLTDGKCYEIFSGFLPLIRKQRC